MRKKSLMMLLLVMPLFYVACSGGKTENNASTEPTEGPTTTTETADASSYDPKRGEGKYDEKNVDVTKFDAALAGQGKKVAETKCLSCHKMTDEKLVGPGWKGVTQRRLPHWIMNFITNPDPMIDKDPEVQAQLELCLVRMPNQNLAENEAREILEYMRQNDGAK
ncbi:MAG TPA: c-type cytochrome [Chitinophagaceae bacterium]|nr:c-type cytochrome [Chitinophagaceae bacterium]MCC6636010.1 cytochrome c [Chitinophagaceae bacterium]HNE93747.1 c-type cytochrome [Chitinophagaceae bacterium]HNF29217.1 c-type cytochrome [Chitinophagaceae bacterium]HNL82453.1 c-type cytochrome [Chitinophagaceae bacterium]